MKPKLAICITGQTREHNKHEDKFHAGLEKLFGEHFDYDLYAHTWNDQVLPTYTSKFQRITTTDQNDLWKSISTSGDPFRAILLTNELRNNSDYKLAINGKGNLVELMQKCITGLYAQLVTTWLCFDSIDNSDQYVGFVKFRWDITCGGNPPSPAEWTQWRQDYRDTVLECSSSSRNAVILNPTLSLPDTALNNSGYTLNFEDMMLTFTPNTYNSFVYRHIHVVLNDMIERGLVTDHSHGLWKILVLYLDSIEIRIPNVNPIGFLSDDYLDQTAKSNKALGY